EYNGIVYLHSTICQTNAGERNPRWIHNSYQQHSGTPRENLSWNDGNHFYSGTKFMVSPHRRPQKRAQAPQQSHQDFRVCESGMVTTEFLGNFSKDDSTRKSIRFLRLH
ncbi:hypothetical protein CDAR_472541, partial [Caerostris darwini]